MSYRSNTRREPSPAAYNYRERSRDDYNRTSSSDYRRSNDYDDIPRSRHSIQINGLPAHIKSYEVEEFLGKKLGGPLKTIYFKPDPKNNEAVVAIRFEDKEKAKICVETLHKTLMLGTKVYIDYFQDFVRHNNYKAKVPEKEDYRARGRSRDRSPIRDSNPTTTRTRYERPDEFYVAAARSSLDYRSNNDRSKYFEEESDMYSPPSNNQSRRAPLLAAPSSNSMDSFSAAVPMNVHSNSTSSQRPIAPAPYPINGPLHSNNNRPLNIPPPGFSSVLPIAKEHRPSLDYRSNDIPSSNPSKFSSTNFPDVVKPSAESKTNNDQSWRTSDPDTFSAARLNTVQTLKYQPQEKKNDIQGLFRLGAVSVEASKNEMRKEKFLRLSAQARSKVEEKKHELLKAYQDDCATYGFLTQSLINKNASLEESLRVALADVLKDLEEGYKKTLDDFIELFLTE